MSADTPTDSTSSATIGLHRPLSDLKFNLVEEVSSCARDPPLNNPTPDLPYESHNEQYYQDSNWYFAD